MSSAILLQKDPQTIYKLQQIWILQYNFQYMLLGKSIKIPNEQEINTLVELSSAAGILKRTNTCSYVPIKLAYYPYETTMQFYKKVEQITKVWQKLIFYSSLNSCFIENVYSQISNTDPIVSNLLRIRRLKQRGQNEISLNVVRCDYFVNKQGLPKLIEVNLMSVSMASHIEKYQNLKKLTDKNNDKRYINNLPNQNWINSIKDLFFSKKLQGIFLFIVQQNQVNINDQRSIQIGLLRYNIQSKRITLLEAFTKLAKDSQNNLKLGEDLVSVVYFRAGYRLQDFEVDLQKTWSAREIIELSNAIKIPSITMELMGQKRMQVQLSKQSVYNQYLSKEEIQLLKLSLVKYWQFDHMEKEEFEELMKQVYENKNEFVLKPNLEGGGNNLYGEQLYQKLRHCDEQQRKKYILMQKIHAEVHQNIIINCGKVDNCFCDYQVSQYGVIGSENDFLSVNATTGFLIRVKCIDNNEGGIMSGGGSLCSWIIDDKEESAPK